MFTPARIEGPLSRLRFVILHFVLALNSLLVLAAIASAQVDITPAWLQGQDEANQTVGGPYYFDQASTRYRLLTDVTARGTAFVVIRPNIELDLNGHTVTYNSYSPVVVPNSDFENVITGTNKPSFWNTSAGQGFYVAPSTNLSENSRLSGKRLFIAYGSSLTSEQRIVSASVSLEPNTSYALAAVFASNVPTSNFYLGLQGTSARVSGGNGNKKDFLNEVVYTTGPQSEARSLEIVATPLPDGESGLASIDKIILKRIQPGVAVGPAPSESGIFYFDYKRFGVADNFTIKNGTLRQGPDGGFKAHGLSLSDKSTIENVTVEVHGEDSHGVWSRYAPATIRNSLFRSNVSLITDRHRNSGFVVFVEGGAIHFENNQIIGGPQGGVYNHSPAGYIGRNRISLSGGYTNNFGILVRGAGPLIEHNVIDCRTGACRGIGLNRDSTSEVRFNTVYARELRNNDEYFQGCQVNSVSGAYALQHEYDRNTYVHDNTFVAIADECSAAAFRHNGGETNNSRVERNVFIAEKSGNREDVIASTVSLEDLPTASGPLKFKDNVLRTNDRWYHGHRNSNVELVGSRFERTDLAASTTRLIGSLFNVEAITDNLTFIDSTFQDVGARLDFENSILQTYYSRPRGIVTNGSFRSDYNLTMKLRTPTDTPVAGANVRIVDARGIEVFAGKTDANGMAAHRLTRFQSVVSAKVAQFTRFSPFLVTFQSETAQVSSTVDLERPITLNCVIGRQCAISEPPAADSTAPAAPSGFRVN